MLPLESEMEKARALYEEGEAEAALDIYRRIHKQHPFLASHQATEYLINSGKICLALDQPQEAESYFRELYREGEKKSDLLQLSLALYELGQLKLTLLSYQEAVDLFREELSYLYSGMEHYFALLARNYLGQGSAFIGMGDRQEAALYFRHAATFAETDENEAIRAEALERQAELQMRDGKKKESLKLYRQALSSYKNADKAQDVSRLTEHLQGLTDNLSGTHESM